MSATIRLILGAIAGVAGISLVVSGARQQRPSLSTVGRHLARQGDSERGGHHGGLSAARVARPLIRRLRVDAATSADLRLSGRTVEQHVITLSLAALGGLFGTALLVALLTTLGIIGVSPALTVVAAALMAVALPAALHSSMRADAAALRIDLRHQLSAYLDVVTMLLAGNVGNEGALRQAAQTGDGRLFVELRRRILIAETSNRSVVAALGQLGDELGLVELQQIAASAALGATAGAPMARSLQAKCATLRSALASDQEADARVRTGKLTLPLVGMSLLIMAAVIYPALNFTR
jgi:tight adherence protein C